MEAVNWGYVMSTLLIRFIGVFIVLAVLEIGIILSSKIIQYFEHPPRGRSAVGKGTPTRKKR